jgi:hypothetical protein
VLYHYIDEVQRGIVSPKIKIEDLLQLLNNKHPDFKQKFERIHWEERQSAVDENNTIPSLNDPVAIRNAITRTLELSSLFGDNEDHDKIIRQNLIDDICNYIIDSDQKNRNILRLKALANAEFCALLKQLLSVSGLQLPKCIFKYRISTLRNGNEASPRIQVQMQIVPKKKQNKSKAAIATKARRTTKVSTQQKTKGRPPNDSNYSKVRDAMFTLARISKNKCGDRTYRRLKEKIAITSQAAEENPDVVNKILRRSQNMTDQKPLQNSVICNEEQTERMNSVIKQVHVMIQSTSKQNRNNIEDAVGLGERGKDNDDEKHRSNSDDNVEYGDSGDEMIDEEDRTYSDNNVDGGINENINEHIENSEDDSDDDSQYTKSIVSLFGCDHHHNNDMDNTSHENTMLSGSGYWDANTSSGGNISQMHHPWDESIKNGINTTNDDNNSTDTSIGANILIDVLKHHNPSQDNKCCLNKFRNSSYREFIGSLGDHTDIDGCQFEEVFNDRSGGVVTD